MKLLLYCTKAKPYLVKRNIFAGVEPSYFTLKENAEDNLNGKIVAECDFEVEEIENNVCGFGDYELPYFETETLNGKEIEDKSCLSYRQLKGYLKKVGNGFYGYNGYAIHIKNLHIFDEPKELSEYGMDFPISPIVKAPQNMMYANGIGERYILISIRPEWLCKILNGEKTIEVRKKVLKEMLD